jgi:hypothetical protein
VDWLVAPQRDGWKRSMGAKWKFRRLEAYGFVLATF